LRGKDDEGKQTNPQARDLRTRGGLEGNECDLKEWIDCVRFT